MDPSAPVAGRTFRIVAVASVHVPLPDQFPVVTLEDIEVPGRSLTFRIGLAEGAALSHALSGTAAPRPSTHELFTTALQRYDVDVLAVRLVGRVGTTYLAELELLGGRGREVLSCRPSDALCLALRRRVPAPVLADERLFTEDGDVLPDDDVPDDDVADDDVAAHDDVPTHDVPDDDVPEPLDVPEPRDEAAAIDAPEPGEPAPAEAGA